MIPVAGSAYTYAYATVGEFLAWIIGWNLILEYAVGATTYSHRLVRLLRFFWRRRFIGLFPAELSKSPGNAEAGGTEPSFIVFNFPAAFIVLGYYHVTYCRNKGMA